jgi:hypothetical protein
MRSAPAGQPITPAERTGAALGLLDAHGDADAVFGFDGVVLVIEAEVELDPVDLARVVDPVPRATQRTERGASTRRVGDDGSDPNPRVPVRRNSVRWRTVLLRTFNEDGFSAEGDGPPGAVRCDRPRGSVDSINPADNVALSVVLDDVAGAKLVGVDLGHGGPPYSKRGDIFQ